MYWPLQSTLLPLSAMLPRLFSRGYGIPMVTFRAVQVARSSWAVERTEPDGLSIVVSRTYANEFEAKREAARLNQEVESRRLW